MKFVLTMHGTRGDVEPCAAVGRELLGRGHEVRIAVPPDNLGLVKAAGLAAVPYGPGVHEAGHFASNFWKNRAPITALRAAKEYLSQAWADMGATVMSLAQGADLLLTGMIQQGIAANVAEHYDIPLAVLDLFPARVNGQLIPTLPSPLIRSAIASSWWLHWWATKHADTALRRQLGLPKATGPTTRQTVEHGSLEIQAYDELYFPGLAAEWADWDGRRPFVGALTMELPTDADTDVLSWIAAGTPPIYFGFGSMPLRSPADTVAIISAACMQLGERALICTGANDRTPITTHISHFDHVKVVDAVNHGAVFPACRAVVHHGGAGTTAAGTRAGVPTLILWIRVDQPIWAAQIKRLKLGTARRFSATTRESLVADLRSILTRQHVTRARQIATRMSKPTESVARAADLLEDAARRRRVG